MLNDKTILITGGTGTFGQKFVEMIFSVYNPKSIIIYSRDEYKQFMMRHDCIKKYTREQVEKLTYCIGDVRDKERLERVCEGVDYIIHAAAMKQVPACEYNPVEAIKTNIHGAQNVIDAALLCNVKKVVALSTDKAVSPINLYGGTKLVSDKLFVAANGYSGRTIFSVVRYGNVAGSRGSVIPFFQGLLDKGETELPITDYRMTRFWIALEEGVQLVFRALEDSKGGETYISKIPSFKITDLAKAMNPEGTMREVGIREGEKLHECMIVAEDARSTYVYDSYYIIYPQLSWWDRAKHFHPEGVRVPEGFVYDSGENTEWMAIEEIRGKINK